MARHITHNGLEGDHSLLERAEEVFAKRLHNVRENGKDSGRYLLGITDNPWIQMRFKTCEAKEYVNIKFDYKIMIGERI